MDVQDVEQFKGLAKNEVAERIKKHGYNEISTLKKYEWLDLFLTVLKEPMISLLIACAVVYFLLGDKLEASVLLCSIVAVISITFYQENKTENTIQALRKLSSPRALVLRNGRLERIPGREVVPDDVVILNEGDRVPADGLVLKAVNMFVDESMLTGESESVPKIADDKTQVYSGTLLVKGHGIIRIIKTGNVTQIGVIGTSIEGIELKDSLLKLETNQIVKGMSIFALVTCLAVVILEIVIRSNLLNGILSGITVAMSMIPEEFPVILTIFLSFGAWRLSKHNVLTRRIPIIETLGAVTTLCVDKTGTITENRMKLAKLWSRGQLAELPDKYFSIPDLFHELVEYGYLAGSTTPTDPVEVEIKHALKTIEKQEIQQQEWSNVKEYSITAEVTAMTKVWKHRTQAQFLAACKGAPESVIKLCNLPENEAKQIENTANILAEEGLRIIAVARSKINGDDKQIPNDQKELNYEFLGLLAFEDPVKEGVAESVQECYTAGIKVMMITGDHAKTALKVAQKIGLINPGRTIQGNELTDISENELRNRIGEGYNVFSRVKPLDKLKLVRALEYSDQIVAMTGDGVNDAPALKEAHVGIAMGKRGTDIAREASGIVLLDDDFNSIVRGIRQGRKIYDNIKKAMSYVLAIHFPIAGMALLPVALGLPTFFFPLHILFLEFLIDPISTIVFEGEHSEKNIMTHKPRRLTDRLLTKDSIIKCIFEGLSVFVVTFVVYWFALKYFSENAARTLAFITLISANLSLVLTNRSEKEIILRTLLRPNKALWTIFFAAACVIILIINSSTLSAVFRFSYVSGRNALFAVVAGLAAVVWADLSKLLRPKTS